MESRNVVGLDYPADARPRPAPTGFEGNTIQDAIKDLLQNYTSFNPPKIDTLPTAPTPLEFLRYVSRNRPFVVRAGASHFPAVQKWSAEYLKNVMRDQKVTVAITPDGNADAVVRLQNGDGREGGGMVFVKPWEVEMPFSLALHHIQQNERATKTKSSNAPSDSDPNRDLQPKNPPIFYAQSQNDNLRSEYAPLFADLPPSIPFASTALSSPPEAINFWLGSSASTTVFHKDNYENVYVQVLGQKKFWLVAPVEGVGMGERGVLGGTYGPKRRDTEGDGVTTTKEGEDGDEEPDLNDLQIYIDEPRTYIPFPTHDPTVPSSPSSQLSSAYPIHPIPLTLSPGDMLYLPALWYHKVSQVTDSDDLCCSVNYWYDLDFSGGFWSVMGFVRGVGILAQQEREEGEKNTKD